MFAVNAVDDEYVDEAEVVTILFAVMSPVTDRDEIVVVAKLEVEVEVSVPTVKLEVDALLRLV